MYNPTVLIISKRKELSIKYKKLIEGLDCTVLHTSNLSEAIGEMHLKEPELIIISDTINESLSEFCQKIRVLTYNFRPIIIAVSKSSELDDKLHALESGADDFLDESMPSKEFKARINAHIRRHLENSINPTTHFINSALCIKALRNTIGDKEKSSVMLINIVGLNYYREIYGQIAYEKVLETVSAIINSTLQKGDIAGHYTNEEFILITTPLKAEKIASFLSFAFDGILERFYNESDFKSNFMTLASSQKDEKRIPLMKLAVAVLDNTIKNFEDYKQILNTLYDILKLCRNSENSCYIIDRPKLEGTVSLIKNKVLIMEPDSALSCLLETAFCINKFDKKIEIKSCLDYEKFIRIYEEFEPKVVILDYGNGQDKQGFLILNEIKALHKTTQKPLPKVIFSTSILDKKKILSSGADVYLPKPYEIGTILDWTRKLLN